MIKKNSPLEYSIYNFILSDNIFSQKSQISAAVSDSNINIDNMLNQSKKDYAYTMFDTNASVGSDIVEKISAINGVIKVRCI